MPKNLLNYYLKIIFHYDNKMHGKNLGIWIVSIWIFSIWICQLNLCIVNSVLSDKKNPNTKCNKIIAPLNIF